MTKSNQNSLLIHLLVNCGFWGIVLAIALKSEWMKEHPDYGLWLMIGCIAFGFLPFLLLVRRQD